MRKLALVFALVASLAACGVGGGDDAEPPTSTIAAPSTTLEGGAPTTEPGDDTTTTDGSGPTSGDEGSYVDALTIGLAAGDVDEGPLVVSDDEAACIAPEWISIIGVDTLVDAGVGPEDLEEDGLDVAGLGLDADQGGELLDVFADCDVDIYQKFFDFLSSGLDKTQTACLRRELDDELARDFLIEALVSTDLPADLQEQLDDLDKTCKLSDGPAVDDGPTANTVTPRPPTTVKPGN